tara:strand:+ start:718 stop:1398 length:681 start_codon:yes stop_codon:yes gene_type:complete
MSSVTSGIEIEMDESKWPMNRSFCVQNKECDSWIYDARCHRMCSDTKKKSDCESKKECDWKPWYNVCKPTYDCTRDKGCAKKCSDKSEQNCKSDPKCEWLGLDCNNVYVWAALEKIGKLNLCKSKEIIASNREIKAFYCNKDRDSKTECNDYQKTHIGFELEEGVKKESISKCTGIMCDTGNNKDVKVIKVQNNTPDENDSMFSMISDNPIAPAAIMLVALMYYLT